jgi:hypothetical protein
MFLNVSSHEVPPQFLFSGFHKKQHMRFKTSSCQSRHQNLLLHHQTFFISTSKWNLISKLLPRQFSSLTSFLKALLGRPLAVCVPCRGRAREKWGEAKKLLTQNSRDFSALLQSQGAKKHVMSCPSPRHAPRRLRFFFLKRQPSNVNRT